jgi:hypothetical protein
MERQHSVEPAACEQVRARFAQFLSGALDPESRGRVRGHVLSCRACALALSQATAESMTPDLAATFSRPMPRPPEAALTALGVRLAHAGTLWTNLQTLAAGPTDWAKAEWDRIRTAMQQWLQELAAAPSPAFTTRGSAERGNDRHLEVPVVDAAGQSLGRTVHFQVVQPPAITKAGEFVCILHTSDPGFAGGSLRCTVTVSEEVKVTFTGECIQKAQGSWVVMISTAGLPTLAEPLVIPARSVEFSVVV